MVAVLYATALAVVSLYGLNLLALAVARWRRSADAGDGSILPAAVLPETAYDLPVVTVQLPLYNEALVARRLIEACIRLRYPPHLLEVQVLDDSTDHTVDIVAEAVREAGRGGVRVVHVRRAERTGYKAGALDAGLRAARGELVALFDADFLPDPDFLTRTVPRFRDPSVGAVQARWTHLNRESSLLTRLQAVGLDTHFAVEQEGRHSLGCFVAFNGTAGIWRAGAIHDAGGWSSDTVTEDLDLSLRAQLRGWRIAYDASLAVPAELPVEMAGFRSQQRRWTAGSVQTARKLLLPLLRSGHRARVLWEGTIQLGANLVYPFVLALLLLHAPLGVLVATGRGPGAEFLAALAFGFAGLIGLVAAQVTAQRALYPDWGRRLADLPAFLCVTMGLALNNTAAVAEALAGRRIVFERTPKFDARGARVPTWWKTPYARRRLPPLVWAEVGLAVYATAGLAALVVVGAWAFVPFQVFAATGAWLVPAWSWRHARRAGT